jgi:hypothetical protein
MRYDPAPVAISPVHTILIAHMLDVPLYEPARRPWSQTSGEEEHYVHQGRAEGGRQAGQG